MKLTFKQRLFLYISIAFALFALSVFLFEQTREKRIKSEAIEEKLGAYADIVNESIAKKNPDQYILILDNLSTLFPANLRLTIVNRNGKVLYDNSILGWSKLENHLGRPEIANSIKNRTGTDIRHSLSTGKEYLYFAKNEGDYFVRVALPNDVQVQRFFKSDNVFLYVTLLLFCILLILVNWIANSFGNSINELRNYAVNPKAKAALNFPKNEIGEIGKEIAENYKQLRATKNKIELER
ncbi:MAG TPA: two-component sensor histidine kinase, partial [Bacteroidia bacterium]|nr:two-component sensor histidine kinase [Bacteroidia bacterium]